MQYPCIYVRNDKEMLIKVNFRKTLSKRTENDEKWKVL